MTNKNTFFEGSAESQLIFLKQKRAEESDINEDPLITRNYFFFMENIKKLCFCFNYEGNPKAILELLNRDVYWLIIENKNIEEIIENNKYWIYIS